MSGMPPIAVQSERAWRPWALLGLAGSLGVALAGPHLAGGPVRWWFDPSLGAALFYAGIVALCAAWLALGRVTLTPRELGIIGAAWCLPLLLTAPLFSQDAYSYLAQGTLVHLGIDPYRHAPAASRTSATRTSWARSIRSGGTRPRRTARCSCGS